MTAVNTESKEVLARLLASENLDVVHDNVQTASFNLETRTLTLPVWDEMTNETYDHLVGHEVGHALFTPQDGWREAVLESSAGFRTFLNVVEDARIERMMQNRFPGLRRSFIASYSKLLADGFFGGDLEKINSMKLIDRLNVYFKCGMTSGVKFQRNEMRWVEAMNSVETFSDAERVAHELYAFAQEEQERAEQEQQEQFEALKASGDMGDEGFGDESFGDDKGEDEDRPSKAAGGSAAGSTSEDVIAETVDKLEQNIKNEFSSNPAKKRQNIYVNWDYDVKDVLIGYKEILTQIDDLLLFGSFTDNILVSSQKKFMSNNKKTIDYLVKEFEMKKAAENYSRAAVSSTGMIDTIKMNSYKYNDDIFRKITVVPDGKNHGLLMFIDWSGSMGSCMSNTIAQMLNLVLFCRQVNIPFQVYSFTDGNTKRDIINTAVDEVAFFSDTLICELFSNKMRAPEFIKMVQYMCVLVGAGQYCYRYFVKSLRMGSTPLNETIVLSKKMFENFKKNNRLDVVNMVFLTDGDSNCINVTEQYDYGSGAFMSARGISYDTYGKENVVKYIDKETKKQYRFNNSMVSYGSISLEETRILLSMLRENTGANVIGFRIFSNKSYELNGIMYKLGVTDVMKHKEMRDKMTKEKFVEIPGAGYSKFFGLYNKDLQISENVLEVSPEAAKPELRRAFGKANKNRLISRVFLNKFIELVA